MAEHDAEDQDPQQQQESEAQHCNGEFAHVVHAGPPGPAGSRRKMIFVRPIVMVEPSVSSVLPLNALSVDVAAVGGAHVNGAGAAVLGADLKVPP